MSQQCAGSVVGLSCIVNTAYNTRWSSLKDATSYFALGVDNMPRFNCWCNFGAVLDIIAFRLYTSSIFVLETCSKVHH